MYRERVSKLSYKKQKYVHKQSKMESQRNAAYIKNIKKQQKKSAIDINITQMIWWASNG